MVLIDWEFQRSAKAVANALNQIRDAVGCDRTSTLSSSSPLELTSWVVEAKHNTIYLAHPPVIFFSKKDNNSHQIDIASGEDMIDSSMSNVEVDEPTVHNSHPNCVTEWTFSVIFHEIWRVPTLYFSVHDIDGTPTTREEVVSILLSNNRRSATDISPDCMTEEQTWDFVSQEEHPITGKPSFFLHPCQTATKMQLLLHQPMDPLLSWMSMILPSVGCTISPVIYKEAQKKIMSMKDDE